MRATLAAMTQTRREKRARLHRADRRNVARAMQAHARSSADSKERRRGNPAEHRLPRSLQDLYVYTVMIANSTAATALPRATPPSANARPARRESARLQCPRSRTAP